MVLVRSVGGILLSNVVCWIPLAILSILYLFIDYNDVPLGIFIFVLSSFTAHSVVVHPIIEGCVLLKSKKFIFKFFSHCIV